MCICIEEQPVTGIIDAPHDDVVDMEVRAFVLNVVHGAFAIADMHISIASDDHLVVVVAIVVVVIAAIVIAIAVVVIALIVVVIVVAHVVPREPQSADSQRLDILPCKECRC